MSHEYLKLTLFRLFRRAPSRRGWRSTSAAFPSRIIVSPGPTSRRSRRPLLWVRCPPSRSMTWEVTQSDAITRYAGKLAGLYPADPLQALFCDEIMAALWKT